MRWGWGGLLLVGLALGCGDDDGVPIDGGADAGCTSAAQCDDGMFCNGAETCEVGVCMPGAPPCEGTCDEVLGCTDGCPDADGDGHEDAACGGDDCDDTDPGIHPSAAEVCDAEGLDEDCDPATLGDDADGDGHVSDRCCNGRGTARVCGDDCDDGMSGVHPGVPDNCNARDDDCDGATDEEPTLVFYRDIDGDGFGDDGESVLACGRPDGFALEPGDCDDSQTNVFPGAFETCDGEVDHDCDESIDEDCDCDPRDFPVACGSDVGECTVGQQRCELGRVTPCDAPRLPGDVAEGCGEGRDEDCDGNVDEGVLVDCWPDSDRDGYADALVSPDRQCRVDLTCDEFFTARRAEPGAIDCEPEDPDIHPGMSELCNGVDDDCDGVAEDADGDGHVAIDDPCSGGPLDTTPRDCNDDAPTVHPRDPSRGIDEQWCSLPAVPHCLREGDVPCVFDFVVRPGVTVRALTCGGRTDEPPIAGFPVCAPGVSGTNAPCHYRLREPGCLTWDLDCSGAEDREPVDADAALTWEPTLGWICPDTPRCVYYAETVPGHAACGGRDFVAREDGFFCGVFGDRNEAVACGGPGLDRPCHEFDVEGPYRCW